MYGRYSQFTMLRTIHNTVVGTVEALHPNCSLLGGINAFTATLEGDLNLCDSIQRISIIVLVYNTVPVLY